MFRVISLNANGIRAAARKGFFEWLKIQNADVVCIQETKAQEYQLIDKCFWPAVYYCYYRDADKKGYSGVAIYTRHKPLRIVKGIGNLEFDNEGRYIEICLGNISVVSLYLPSGSSGEVRQEFKFRSIDIFRKHLKKLKRRKAEFILCGDWNIAHKKIDIKNWRGNKRNSGFLPEERKWMDDLFNIENYIDKSILTPHNREFNRLFNFKNNCTINNSLLKLVQKKIDNKRFLNYKIDGKYKHCMTLLLKSKKSTITKRAIKINVKNANSKKNRPLLIVKKMMF